MNGSAHSLLIPVERLVGSEFSSFCCESGIHQIFIRCPCGQFPGFFQNVLQKIEAALLKDQITFPGILFIIPGDNAFIGQNYGAGKMDRVKKGYRASLWTVGIWGLFITFLFVCFPEPISRVFFHEPLAIATSVGYMIIIGFSEAFMSVELMTVGALSGLGKTHLCSVISITLTSARIPLAILLSGTTLGLLGIWWALSATSIVKGVVFVAVFYLVVRNMKTM